MDNELLPIQEASGKSLMWVQPHVAERKFVLKTGEGVFARLNFHSAWGSLARGVSCHGRWTFKRVGFFRPRVTVRREDSDEDLAAFTPGWNGSDGEIEWADGRRHIWKSANFWATNFAITTAEGDHIILFKEGVKDAHFGDLFKVQAEVVIARAIRDASEMELLVILGWYLMVLNFDDTAASTSTIAGAIS